MFFLLLSYLKTYRYFDNFVKSDTLVMPFKVP